MSIAIPRRRLLGPDGEPLDRRHCSLLVGGLFGGNAPRSSAYKTGAVVFDGTNDYLTRGADYTNNANGPDGFLSFWWKNNGGGGTSRFIMNAPSNNIIVEHQTDNKIRLKCIDTSGAGDALAITSTAAYNDTNWHHLLCSWRNGATDRLYIDDAADGSAAGSGTDSDFTHTEHSIGATTGGGSKFVGDIADVFFHRGYLDLSVEANRRLFRSATGKPVNLGADGSIPFGAVPMLYLRLAPNADPATFATNLGTGGGMTVNGTLTTASTSPSD